MRSGFHYRLCRILFRQHSMAGNTLVASLVALGLGVTAYAAWRVWRSEAEELRARYAAAADNRVVAIERGATELLNGLRGIAVGTGDREPGQFDTAVETFMRGNYKRGAVFLLSPERQLLRQHCLGGCGSAGYSGLPGNSLIEAAVSQSRLSGQPAAAPPVPMPGEPGGLTAWIALALPAPGSNSLLAVVDARDLVEGELAYLRPHGIDVYVFDETDARRLVYFHRSRLSRTPPGSDPGSHVWTADQQTSSFLFAGRNWVVRTEPVVPIVSAIGSGPWLVLAVGVLLTGGVAFALGGQIRLRRAVQRQVERRTRQLNQANRELQAEVEQRKRTELELARARDHALEHSRLKSEFLANMSHEIRTPMNGVIGMTEIVLDTELSPEQREYVTIIQISATSLLTIINDILDFSKVEAGKMEMNPTEFGLAEVVDEVAQMLSVRAQQKKLVLNRELQSHIPAAIVADRERLKQVLTNLVGNAIKFTDRGSVAIRAELAQPLRGHKEASQAVEIHFAVSDTGIGIPQQKVHSIFEAFIQADGSSTRRHGGTGLGLSIASKLVALMGGRIWVESRVGAGSTFHFTIACRAGDGAGRHRFEQASSPVAALAAL